MPLETYYMQDCPTCGRALKIRVKYLGQTLACQHCRGKFEARENSIGPGHVGDDRPTMIQRADQLLSDLG